MTLLSPDQCYAAELADALFDYDQQLLPITYTNSILSGEGVAEAYDPGVILSRQQSVVYLPGGNPEGGATITLVKHNLLSTELDEELFARTRSLYIGEAALTRAAEDGLHDLVKWHIDGRLHASRRLGTSALDAIGFLKANDLPLAIVSYFKVLASEALPTGTAVASLHHPIQIHPKLALRRLQKAV